MLGNTMKNVDIQVKKQRCAYCYYFIPLIQPIRRSDGCPVYGYCTKSTPKKMMCIKPDCHQCSFFTKIK